MFKEKLFADILGSQVGEELCVVLHKQGAVRGRHVASIERVNGENARHVGGEQLVKALKMTAFAQ